MGTPNYDLGVIYRPALREHRRSRAESTTRHSGRQTARIKMFRTVAPTPRSRWGDELSFGRKMPESGIPAAEHRYGNGASDQCVLREKG